MIPLLLLALATTPQDCTTPNPGPGFTCAGGQWWPPGATLPGPPPPPPPPPKPTVNFPPANVVEFGESYSAFIGWPAQACNGPRLSVDILNPYPNDIYLTGASFWAGASAYIQADIVIALFTFPKGWPQLVFTHNWDRYAPTAQHDPWMPDWSAKPFRVKVGEKLRYEVECRTLPRTSTIDPLTAGPMQHHQSMLLYFTVGTR